jgi:hypothetical protein
MIPAAAKVAVTKIAEYVAFAAVFGTVGTYWINTEVERRMGELEQDPSQHPAVVTLQAEVKGMKESQVRVERKVDAFSTKFLEYLERQTQ